MSKSLCWREEWSLGMEPLDTDHRVLVKRYADLVRRFCPEASARRAGRADALVLGLTDLGEAARAHFQRTDTLMETLGYEGVVLHQGENALMMADYTAQLREWREEGLQVFVEDAQAVVREWLLEHILVMDRDFAAYWLHLDQSGADPRSVEAHGTAARSPSTCRLSLARPAAMRGAD